MRSVDFKVILTFIPYPLKLFWTNNCSCTIASEYDIWVKNNADNCNNNKDSNIFSLLLLYGWSQLWLNIKRNNKIIINKGINADEGGNKETKAVKNIFRIINIKDHQ